MIPDLNFISNDFKRFYKSLENIHEPHLISYAFIIGQLNPLSLINTLTQFSDDVFFFRTPDNKLTLIGLNSALELSSDHSENFTSASSFYNDWKKNIFNNLDDINIPGCPIICCTAKFDATSSSLFWNDFEPLRIYIPEFIFSFREGEAFCCFNFIQDAKKSIAQISARIFTYLNQFSQLSKNSPSVGETKINSPSNSGTNELQNWYDISKKALKELNGGAIEKLVLSRAYSFNLSTTTNWNNLINNLYLRFPDCYLFFIKRKKSFFFGSSPEMFLKVSGNIAEVESVAGSAPRGERSEADYELEKFLKTSEKNHREHLFVSEYISEILVKYSDNVRIIEEKQIRKLDNIQHLITRISAELNYNQDLFELINSLFPTPAVCGVPKDAAKNLIRKLETHDRGLYSGLIGVMDFDGNCELAVSIRSALVNNNTITAFAGAGLVRNSDLHEEFLETNLKLNPILSLFNDENKSQ